MFFHEMMCVIFSFNDMHRNFLLARGFFEYNTLSMNKITLTYILPNVLLPAIFIHQLLKINTYNSKTVHDYCEASGRS